MKTQEVIKSGIDRNFLRECERKGLIDPQRNDNEWIIDKRYTPREYSQEEVETVWNAYLYRKMGLSYSQIKKILQGEEIPVKDSLNALIEKYENQIEELKVLIEFMSYVKGLGFIPTPPDILIESKNFKDYLIDFIKYIDSDKKMLKFFNAIDSISDIQNPDIVDENQLNKIENLVKELEPNINEADMNNCALALLDIKEKTNLKTNCKEIQNNIHKLFEFQKKLSNNNDLTAWQFATSYIGLLSYDSDISAMFKNFLGEEAFKYLIDALISFLIIEEPEKVAEIRLNK